MKNTMTGINIQKTEGKIFVKPTCMSLASPLTAAEYVIGKGIIGEMLLLRGWFVTPTMPVRKIKKSYETAHQLNKKERVIGKKG